MGTAYRDAGRIVAQSTGHRFREGFFDELQQMDQMPVTGMVMTYALDGPDMIGSDHETRVVTTGPDALQLLMQEPDETRFDIILCDLHMPEISGMDLHEKLAELRPAIAERMVFMTGGAFTERSRDFVSKVGSQLTSR